jgi:hypothetical protein
VARRRERKECPAKGRALEARRRDGGRPVGVFFVVVAVAKKLAAIAGLSPVHVPSPWPLRSPVTEIIAYLVVVHHVVRRA